MAINIEIRIEKALEDAFGRALDHAIQAKAEAIFTKAFENGAVFGKKLDEMIEEGLQRFTKQLT